MPKRRRNSNSLSDLIPKGLNPLHQARIIGRLVRRSGKGVGLPPGTLVHTGRRKVERTRLHAIRYRPPGVQEETWDRLPEDLGVPAPDEGALWVNMDGLHDVDTIRTLGEALGVHPLALEDVAHVGQRPKLEAYDTHLYVVLHMLRVEETPFRIEDEQVSLVFGPGYLVSFQEAPGDVFGPVRDRLRAENGRIRTRGSDYLAYALIDALVDSHFQVIEKLGEEMEALESEIIETASRDSMHRLHDLKRELLVVRRGIWPLRELLGSFLRVEPPLVAESTRIYLRDVHDHTYQLIETVELLRDIASGMRDIYLSTVSNRTNEVMKVLTIMASIFIPLTFIAGVYGMNFEHMPELELRWAYPAILLFMLAVTLGLLGFFRYKRWI